MKETSRPTGSVVVPAYNEAGNIGPSLLQIADVLEQTLPARSWQVVVVDDGSTDSTVAEAESAGGNLVTRGIDVRIVRHVVNRGLGNALQTAFRATTGDVVVVIDCDLSYSADHIPRLVENLIERQAKMCIASPYMDGGTTVAIPRHIERRSRVANSFLSTAVHGEILTLTGMVRAYDGAFIRGLALRSTDAEINIETIYKAQILGARIVEIPATLDWSGLERRASRTRMTNPRTRSKIYKTFINGVLFRPYVLFAIAGFLLICFGALIALIAALLEGPQVELAVLGICAIATGVLLGFAGLLSVQVKRCFEELFFLGSKRIAGEGTAYNGPDGTPGLGLPELPPITVIPHPAGPAR
jgi:glycosyltransferase involved in cell wall biosynthesis